MPRASFTDHAQRASPGGPACSSSRRFLVPRMASASARWRREQGWANFPSPAPGEARAGAVVEGAAASVGPEARPRSEVAVDATPAVLALLELLAHAPRSRQAAAAARWKRGRMRLG